MDYIWQRLNIKKPLKNFSGLNYVFSLSALAIFLFNTIRFETDTINKIITLIETIAAPEGMFKEYAIHNPKKTLSSENKIEIAKVDLKLQPILIALATGIIIIEEINNTPADSNITDTTMDKTIINIIWNTLTLTPKNLAVVSSKLTERICLPKARNNAITIKAVIKINIR